MATVTGVVDAHRRLIIDVALQPAPVVVHGVQPHTVVPTSQVSALRGLIDTGATKTCISRSAAKQIGLRPRGKLNLGGVSSIEQHNRYRFVLGALYDDKGARGYYMFDEVSGVDFRDNGDFDVLIGMDVIAQGDLTLTRAGTFTWMLP
ncbi:Aspartyl protease [Sphingomonas gellani]|uniref:Aspartyl protease n=1 Tax=Sphingomonas gellani TaxID=1166340 RepID=A0A1H8C3W2_9SPHN|nr:aspartyl protease family protein [Sphingomonas gellani]SEM88968.1 Aspartyl protease [Sphingomonas gellani]